MFSCSPFFLFGKDGDFLSAKNTFPEASGNAPPTFKYFPKLRKTPRRRKSSFRNFGNLRADGKTLSETSGSPAAAEKHFPKLREALPCRGNTKKAATITCDSFTYFYKKTDYPKNEIRTPAATAEPITPEILLAMQY